MSVVFWWMKSLYCYCVKLFHLPYSLLKLTSQVCFYNIRNPRYITVCASQHSYYQIQNKQKIQKSYYGKSVKQRCIKKKCHHRHKIFYPRYKANQIHSIPESRSHNPQQKSNEYGLENMISQKGFHIFAHQCTDDNKNKPHKRHYVCQNRNKFFKNRWSGSVNVWQFLLPSACSGCLFFRPFAQF